LGSEIIEILTGPTLDCGPQPVGTSSALRWSETTVKPTGRGGGGVAPGPDFLCYFIKMNIQPSFFLVVYEVKKD
jgi:hypothetical protein